VLVRGALAIVRLGLGGLSHTGARRCRRA
jgi:hypothetical protein